MATPIHGDTVGSHGILAGKKVAYKEVLQLPLAVNDPTTQVIRINSLNIMTI